MKEVWGPDSGAVPAAGVSTGGVRDRRVRPADVREAGSRFGPVPELVRASAHVFADDLDEPALTAVDVAHLEKSLRLRDGEEVTVSDGSGAWRRFLYRRGTLEPAGPIRREVLAGVGVRVAFALTGSSAAREVAQRLTEVGVDALVPMVTGRSVQSWPVDRARRLVDALRRVVREAAMQARRVTVPEIAEVAPFDVVVERWGDGALLAVPGATPLPPEIADRTTILVGPEGGWSDSELACGLPPVGLGPAVLRSETAAVVAGALLVDRLLRRPGIAPTSRMVTERS